MKRRAAYLAVLGIGVPLVWAAPAYAQEQVTVETVQAAVDNSFVLLAGVLVIFMQAGFALVEAGFTRAKNVANIMMKNLMDFMAGVLAFFCVGYAIAFGPGNDFFGSKGFFLGSGAAAYTSDLTVNLFVFFVFQLAFAATAATIVSGAMAERTKFKSYFVYSLFITAFIYPVVVHWLWGGGWLSQLGTAPIDFAGSTIVHTTGGVAALIGAIGSAHASASTRPTAGPARSKATRSPTRCSGRSTPAASATGSTTSS